MEAEGPLLTIAEVSVAFAGFSSVALALRRVGQRWEAQDRSGLSIVLAASFGAFVFSILPFPLRYLRLPPETVWGVTNGLFGVTILASIGVLTRWELRHPARSPGIYWSAVTLNVSMAGLLIGSAFDWVVPRSPAILILGLLVVLGGAFAQLFTFLRISWSEPGS